MKTNMLAVFFIVFIANISWAQSLDDILNEDQQPSTEYVEATFKSPRLINGYTIENAAKQELIFCISHRFGAVSGGAYELFGFDDSQIRLGFEYGITNRFVAGIGRSSFDKSIDGYLKYKLLRQSTGAKTMPVSVSVLAGTAVSTLKWDNPDRDNLFSSRMSYAYQVLIARKFSNMLSLQLMPTLIHRNLVATIAESNDVYAIGVGGRLKLTSRVTFNTEYYAALPNQLAFGLKNALSVGFDIETGGHVFQLHFTNSRGMHDSAFITQNTGSWLDSDIHFGFNVNRTFSLSR